jgi:hypothetical protein
MVSSVPTVMPPTMTQPICWRLSAPAPLASANGSAPRTMAPVVIRMGRRRKADASTTASITDLPCWRSWLLNSTIRMPCLVMSPISVIRPICEYTFSVPPVNFIASSAPSIDKGTLSRMTNGSMKLSNCALSTRKMNSSASTNTTPRAPLEALNSRLTPLSSVA